MYASNPKVVAFLDYRWKVPLHIIELVLIIAVLAISGARLTLPNLPRTRANTIALGFSAKSIAFISYQLLTEHVQSFSKWKSYKAYTIINGLEVVFWGAVAFLLIQANINRCIGTGCTLSWVVVGLSIVLNFLSLYAFGISYIRFKQFRQGVVPQQQHAPRTMHGMPHATCENDSILMESRQWSGSSIHEQIRK